ncbi:MAG: hypothetical protein LBD02_08965 [Christensenellaceae bacterium]|jgi:hypothetical protein|nr:hypothetical protein [Christensenellaceae bacterium]
MEGGFNGASTALGLLLLAGLALSLAFLLRGGRGGKKAGCTGCQGRGGAGCAGCPFAKPRK